MGGCNSSIAPKDFAETQATKQMCHHCKKHDFNLLKLACEHHYHEICLISKKMDSNKCICGKDIGQLNKINEQVHRLFLTYQAQMIVQLNQNKLQINETKQQQFFRCPKKGCSFYFIQDQKPQQGQLQEYFCDQCNCKLQYDLLKSDFSNAKSDASTIQPPKGDQTNVKSDAVKIQPQVPPQQSTKIKPDYLFQLHKIIEAKQQPFKFCRNDCGFMYIENNSYNIGNSLCENCDFCHKCYRLLFSDFISLKKCKHKFHLLCANSVINPDKLESLNCDCGEPIDDEDIKIEFNISCMICGKFDKNLKRLDCQHYIHLDCIQDNSFQFSDFLCFICKIPILEFLKSSKHQKIHNQIKKNNIEKLLVQIENDCFICYNKSEEHLYATQCNHKVHLSCLESRKKEIKDKQQLLKCSCGQYIKDIQQKIE
ncbi:unnamed protein product (macronuclear) [Paramecium tetraurelia]|uniref:RING-type domain-containing protein n=1 Tax=Paramecium tetraurelia TaxID=5888 RepID=A0CSN4_PARTE|nr:uncharacterized protein GSPATT00010073001 [Paramecium tetraurelia]CAK73801.1 unnamed protein product [Paramecium tetraurelia]|eukprot:XP_001441198.1 hypothetical protein (macronuclear) [Paramecium tetraurelia strain d4-2]